jgi:hypothetical protein
MWVAAIWVHNPKTISVTCKNDPTSIWRKLRRIQRADVLCEARQPIAVDIDGVNLIRSTLPRGKINRLTIRRERCIKGSRLKVGELPSVRAIPIHDTDLINLVNETCKHDLAR